MKPLQGSKAPEILLILNRKPNLSLSDLIYLTGSNPSLVSKRVLELKESGLITEKRHTDFTRKREFNLTEKGRKVAVLLLEIKKVLDEE